MDSDLPTLLELRLLVGFLGERAQFGWWPSAFYDASSTQFLAPVFTKTIRLAQYHGVLEAARRVHDEHLSAGSFHLFRLPEEIEQLLHTLVQAKDAEAPPGRALGKDSTLEALKQLAGGKLKASEGPVAIGSIKGVHSPEVLRGIASAYAWAFSRDAKTYPYLVR